MAKPLTHWPPMEYVQITQALEGLKSDIAALKPGEDPNRAGWMAQLLVIKSAGYIEQSALLTARAHISTLAAGTVQSYGLSRVEKYFGPKPNQLEVFVGRFSGAWREELTELFDANDEALRRSVRALVGERDQVAHGRSTKAGIVRAMDYCVDAESIANWFVLRLNPLTPSV